MATSEAPRQVLLTAEVITDLHALAHLRNKDKHPSQSRRQSAAYTDLALDVVGIKGEYVVSRVFGVPMDRASYAAGGDTGVDVWIGGHPCAVKTNHRHDGYLIVERQSDLAAVEYVLAVDGPCDPPRRCLCHAPPEPGEPEWWRYVGWLSVPDFWREATKTNWGLGQRWYVRQPRLHQTPIL